MLMKRIGGAIHQEVNEALGKAAFSFRSIGKSANEINELGKEIGENVAKKNKKISNKIDAYDSYSKAIKEANKKTSNMSKNALNAKAKPINNYQTNTSFVQDGLSYRIQDGSYQVKTNNGWADISSKEYGHVRGEYISRNRELEQAAEDTINAANIANSVKEKWDGLPGWGKTSIIATAGVIAGSAIFGNDDDEY